MQPNVRRCSRIPGSALLALVTTLAWPAIGIAQPPSPQGTPTRDRGVAPASRPATTPAPSASTAAPAVAFPHPIITEVLASVPPGLEGDADQSGRRLATGDEFIELANPHDKPINLKGYVLTDGDPVGAPPRGSRPSRGRGPAQAPSTGSTPSQEPVQRDDSRMRFVFPEVVLEPGQVVVVFNGYAGAPPGPVGDSTSAAEPNEHFLDARIFSMRCRSEFQALSNQHDMVVLLAPDGHAVECVRWDFRDADDARRTEPADSPDAPQRDAHPPADGDMKKRTPDRTPDRSRDRTRRGPNRDPQDRESAPPRDKVADQPADVTEDAPRSRGSVQRESFGGGFVPHDAIDGRLFSPGEFVPR